MYPRKYILSDALCLIHKDTPSSTPSISSIVYEMFSYEPFLTEIFHSGLFHCLCGTNAIIVEGQNKPVGCFLGHDRSLLL